MQKTADTSSLLRSAGLRATPGRIRILAALARLDAPASIPHLKKNLGKNGPDDVTLYRALDALAAAGIVVRADLQHGHAHYELAAGRKHHHHVVCKNCGRVEDIEVTHAAQPEREALRRTKGFASIDAYALEFFGVCIQCS
jgi:Fur family ferric uptake transcriptional regulator